MKNISKVLSLVAFVVFLAGCSGDSGATGATGATGENGADGATGATGATGENGADGADGATGENGADGVDGATGENGADGVDGATGENGADGATGATGLDGFVSLIKMSDEPVGANCQNGGVKVESGLDLDGDDVLAMGEVTATKYICSDQVLAENFDGVVYIADKTIDGANSIYATVNGVDTLLAAPSQSNQDINAFKISPDRSKVAYIIDGNLYTVDLLKPSVPVQMNVDLVANGDVVSYEWSPDGSKLAYRGDVETDGVFELYVVLGEGSLNMKVHPTLSGDQDAEPYYEWSHDSQKLAYVTDELVNDARDLHIIDVATDIHTLVKTMAGGREVIEMHWSSNDSSIAYRDDSVTDDEYDLHSYNITNTAVTTIKSTSAGSSIDGFSWKPPVSGIVVNPIDKIAYTETDTSKTDLYTYSFAEGFSTPSSTTQNTVLTGEFVKSFKWSQDGKNLAYLKQESLGNNLYVVAAAATTSHKINPDIVGGGGIETYAWGYVPTGVVLPGTSLPKQRLVFNGDIDVSDINDVYAANLDGTGYINLTNSSNIASNIDAYDFILAKDAKTVLYRMDKDTNQKFELYTIDLYGNNASATVVSGDMPDYADVKTLSPLIPGYAILQPQ